MHRLTPTWPAAAALQRDAAGTLRDAHWALSGFGRLIAASRDQRLGFPARRILQSIRQRRRGRVRRNADQPSTTLGPSHVVARAEASVDVVVDYADVLHERVHTRGPDEAVRLRLQLFRECL